MRIGLDRERKLVLVLVQKALAENPPEKEQAWGPKEPNWDRAERIAVFNGVAPLLHGLFSRQPRIEVPPSFKERMRREHLENLTSGLLLEKALLEIEDTFSRIGLAHVVHKGLVLSALVYPDENLRPCGTDLDIFIRRSDYGEAKEALFRIGYLLDNPPMEHHQAAFIGEVHFFKKIAGQKVIVDLHVDFNPNHWGKVSGFHMSVFDTPSIQVPIQGRPVPHLPVERCLFFLCIHCAANHIFDKLILLCDIHFLVGKFRTQLDWERVGKFAKSLGCRKTLYHSLNLCRNLLGTPIPETFLEDLFPGKFSASLVPVNRLLLQWKKPPKWLERYMHLVLLDDPLLFFKSVSIFARKIASQYRPVGQPPADVEHCQTRAESRERESRVPVSKVRVGKDLYGSVKKAVDLVGGIEQLVSSGDRVLIKANFNSPDPYPASSDLAFIRCVVQLLRARGVTDIALGESSGLYWHPTARVLRKKKVPQFARKLGIELVNFDLADQWDRVKIAGKHYKSAYIARAVLEADKLIYICNLKTHWLSRFTMSLKMVVGMMEPSTRRRLHADHLEEKIADVNLAVAPDLILIDGRKCFVTRGPHKGKIRNAGVVLASTDRVAIDVEAVKILQGFRAKNGLNMPVWSLPQIAAARRLKIGSCGEEDYRVIPADLR